MLTTYLFRVSGLFVTVEGVIGSYVGSKIQKQSDLDFEEKTESILKKVLRGMKNAIETI